jgi:hypothetical protein
MWEWMPIGLLSLSSMKLHSGSRTYTEPDPG